MSSKAGAAVPRAPAPTFSALSGAVNPFGAPSPLLSRVCALLGSSAGLDAVLSCYQYSASLFAFVVLKVLLPRLATGLKGSKSDGKLTRLAATAAALGKLAGLVTDARILYRLVGSFGMISWMQSFHTASSPPRGGDTRLKAIEYLQAWTMLLYQPLENVWYLAYKGIVALPPGKRDRIGLWSCRCWAAYVVLQLLHIQRDTHLLLERQAAHQSSGVSSTSEKETLERAKERREHVERRTKALRLDLAEQIGWLPLTAHWSLPNGLLPEGLDQAFGTLASSCNLVKAWGRTAAAA